MKKLVTTNISSGSGMPIKSGTIDHIQSAYQEMLNGLATGIISLAMPSDFPFEELSADKIFIIKGCNPNSTNSLVPASLLWYNGELFYSDTQTISIVSGNTRTWEVVESYVMAPNADQVEFTDGINRSVHLVRKMRLVNTPNPIPDSKFAYSNAIKLNISSLVTKTESVASVPSALYANFTGSASFSNAIYKKTANIVCLSFSATFIVTDNFALDPGVRAFAIFSFSNFTSGSQIYTDMPNGLHHTIALRKDGTNDFCYGKISINKTFAMIEINGQFPSNGTWKVDDASITYHV